MMLILSKYIRYIYTCPARGIGGLTVTCPPEEIVDVDQVVTWPRSVVGKACFMIFKLSNIMTINEQ